MMKFFSIVFYTVFIGMILGIAGLLVGSMLPIPGNVEIKIVKSGSMEPAIMTGAIVVVKPASTYVVGDVITFGKDTKTDIPTTHRIIGIREEAGQVYYTTKGDANEEPDPNDVRASEVIGKVLIDFPGIGYVLDFARKPLGFALLVGIPAFLVILEEVWAIAREVRIILRKRREAEGSVNESQSTRMAVRAPTAELRAVYVRRFPMDEVFVPTLVEKSRIVWNVPVKPMNDYYGPATLAMMALVFFSTGLTGAAGGTRSYFSDIERSLANVMQAGEWGAPVEEVTFASFAAEEFVEEDSTEEKVPEEENTDAPEDAESIALPAEAEEPVDPTTETNEISSEPEVHTPSETQIVPNAETQPTEDMPVHPPQQEVIPSADTPAPPVE